MEAACEGVGRRKDRRMRTFITQHTKPSAPPTLRPLCGSCGCLLCTASTVVVALVDDAPTSRDEDGVNKE